MLSLNPPTCNTSVKKIQPKPSRSNSIQTITSRHHPQVTNQTGGSGAGSQAFPISGVRLFANMLSDLDGHYPKYKHLLKTLTVMSVRSRQRVREPSEHRYGKARKPAPLRTAGIAAPPYPFNFSAKSAIASEILIPCGQTASQLLHPTHAPGRFSSGSIEIAIGARKPPPVKQCSL